MCNYWNQWTLAPIQIFRVSPVVVEWTGKPENFSMCFYSSMSLSVLNIWAQKLTVINMHLGIFLLNVHLWFNPHPLVRLLLFLTPKLNFQAPWSDSKEVSWPWPCWTLPELCCPLPTNRGTTRTPRTKTKRRSGGVGRPPLRLHRRARTVSLPCCVQRSRPRWWPCPPTPPSTSTASQRTRLCCAPTWCRWPGPTALPVSVPTVTSWLWGTSLPRRSCFYFVVSVSPIETSHLSSQSSFPGKLICGLWTWLMKLTYTELVKAPRPSDKLLFLMIISLPSLRPLLDVNYLPLTDMRIARTFCFSSLGQALYLTSPTEIQRITYSQETCDNLQVRLQRH